MVRRFFLAVTNDMLRKDEFMRERIKAWCVYRSCSFAGWLIPSRIGVIGMLLIWACGLGPHCFAPPVLAEDSPFLLLLFGKR